MRDLYAGRNMASQSVGTCSTNSYFESLILFVTLFTYEVISSCLHTVSHLMVKLVWTGLDFVSDSRSHLGVVAMVQCKRSRIAHENDPILQN